MKTDRNGLELMDDTEGTYKGIIYDLQGGYFAVTGLTYKNKGETANYIIGHFEDPRDAAFISQKFSKKYRNSDVKELVDNGEFALKTNEIIQKTEIPKWRYPSVTDGTGDYEYVKQYVETPSAALIEAFDVFAYQGSKEFDVVKKMIEEIEKSFSAGIALRKAARKAIGVE